MKSVNSLIKWILFVPVCLMSVAISFFNGLHPGSVADFFATNTNGVAEIIAFSVLGLFIICFIISLFDRKTSPVHMLKKNIFCGVTALLTAVSMAANAAFDITEMINGNSDLRAMSVITALVTAVAGVTMLYLGLNHFSAKNTTKKITLLYLSLPLWCGAHLIDRFLNNTATPVAAAESLDLIMFVALSMFFINAVMLHAVISVKNAVKSTINFGLPAVVITFVYSISQFFSVVNDESFTFLKLIPAITYAMVALYTMGFVAELSFKSKTIDEQIVLSENEEINPAENEYYSEDETENSEDFTDQSLEDIAYNDDFSELITSKEAQTDEILSTSDEEDEILGEDNIEFDSESTDVSVTSAAPVVVPSLDLTGIILTLDDEEDEDDLPVALDDDIDFFDDESDSESSVADELFKAAQMRDNKNFEEKDNKESAISAETQEPEAKHGSEEMIIDGDSKRVEPVYTQGKDEKPKGPTTREALMYEGDDFILSVDNNDFSSARVVDEEDVSAFILDISESERDDSGNKSYEERLDEIDKLIISIQGGDKAEDK